MTAKSSKRLLIAYYGDDFTGSTDVMEALARANIKTVLFLKPPTSRDLARFPHLRAFGIAGGSRAMSPVQMRVALPRAFQALKASKARFIHYKTCSTFDSSPTVGSIGKAIELGRRVFGQKITPLVIGVPVLGRHVVFGNLFARSGLDTELFRLDRHPTMSRHPITPMDEADIRVHLARQTRLPIELADILKLRGLQLNSKRKHSNSAPAASLREFLADLSCRKPPPIVLFDTLDESDLPVIGRVLSDQGPAGEQLFCVGSSGIEYALAAYWRETGILPDLPPPGRHLNGTRDPLSSQILAISGSCSPVTGRQINLAIEAGFVGVPCDTRLLADKAGCAAGVARALAQAQRALDSGRNVIFHTALGAADPRRAGDRLGKGLARILASALFRTGARHAVVCGGDTATQVARTLRIEALEFVRPVTPGAPLCRVHAPESVLHGCQAVFKGGQVGRDSFFSDLLDPL